MNGLTKAEARKLSYDEKLDLLADALNLLNEQVTTLIEGQEEILEKLSNFRTPSGSGYRELDVYGGDL